MLGIVSKDPTGGYILIAALIIFWTVAIIWGRKQPASAFVSVDKDEIVVSLVGPSRLLALRKEVRFPVSSVIRVTSTPNVFSRGGTFSRRVGTLSLPTFFRVGSYRATKNQAASFWACFRGENAITFELRGDRYAFVVVEVFDPSTTLELLHEYGI